MKKLFLFLLTLVMVLFFASCEEEEFTLPVSDTTVSDPNDPSDTIPSDTTSVVTGGDTIDIDPDPIPDFIPSKIETLEEFRHVVEELCDGAPYSPITGESWLRECSIDNEIYYQYYDFSYFTQVVFDYHSVKINKLSCISYQLSYAKYLREMLDSCKCEDEAPAPSTLPQIPDTIRKIPIVYKKNLSGPGSSHDRIKSCFNIGETGYVVVEAIAFNNVSISSVDTIYTNSEFVAKLTCATFYYENKLYVVASLNSLYKGRGSFELVNEFDNALYVLHTE